MLGKWPLCLPLVSGNLRAWGLPVQRVPPRTPCKKTKAHQPQEAGWSTTNRKTQQRRPRLHYPSQHLSNCPKGTTRKLWSSFFSVVAKGLQNRSRLQLSFPHVDLRLAFALQHLACVPFGCVDSGLVLTSIMRREHHALALNCRKMQPYSSVVAEDRLCHRATCRGLYLNRTLGEVVFFLINKQAPCFARTVG